MRYEKFAIIPICARLYRPISKRYKIMTWLLENTTSKSYMYDLSNNALADDLELPLTVISDTGIGIPIKSKICQLLVTFMLKNIPNYYEASRGFSAKQLRLLSPSPFVFNRRKYLKAVKRACVCLCCRTHRC